jgi:hypothetical protein
MISGREVMLPEALLKFKIMIFGRTERQRWVRTASLSGDRDSGSLRRRRPRRTEFG